MLVVNRDTGPEDCLGGVSFCRVPPCDCAPFKQKRDFDHLLFPLNFLEEGHAFFLFVRGGCSVTLFKSCWGLEQRCLPLLTCQGDASSRLSVQANKTYSGVLGKHPSRYIPVAAAPQVRNPLLGA